MDEPTELGGTDTAPNMVEMVFAAYGCCLTTGSSPPTAMRVIELVGVHIELEGELDLRGVFGLSDDVPAGFTAVRVKMGL